MKISIFGSGKFVERLAKDLAREKNQVKIFVQEERQNKKLLNIADIEILLYGDYFELVELLPDLSKEEAILLLEDQDQDNLFLARIFSTLATKLHLLIHDVKKYNLLRKRKEVLAYSSLHCPSVVKAKAIQKLYYDDKGLSTQAFDNFQLSLLKYPIEDQPEFVDRRVKDIGAFEDLVLIGIRRGRQILVPNGYTKLEKNDRIHLVGTTQAIGRFKRRHHVYRELLTENKKSFLIYGLDEKSLAIGRGLLNKGADVTYVWNREFSPRDWSHILPEARYLSCRDKTLMESFSDLDIKSYDGFIASSSHDGDNIMAILVAYNLGLRSSVLFIEDESMLFSLDTEKVVAVYTGNHILAQRMKRTITGPRDLSFHLLSTSLEAYEIIIREGAQAEGKTIEELDLPKGLLIAGILRQGQNLIPKGNVIIKKGDQILVFTLPEKAASIDVFLQKELKRGLLTELLDLY